MMVLIVTRSCLLSPTNGDCIKSNKNNGSDKNDDVDGNNKN